MSSKETMVSTLAKLLNGFSYALVDTCSLMEESFEIWFENLKKVKQDLKKEFHIYVLGKCEEELKKHSKSEEENKAKAAKKALEILKKQKRDHLIEITKIEKNQNFADNTIYNKVAQDRINYKIIVITQDKSLATDLKGLNNLMSQRGFKVATYKIDQEGILKINKGESKLIPAKEPLKKPKEGKVESKPHPVKPTGAPNQNLLLEKAISADKKLKCNLFNPNYPKEKKLADLKAQQELLLKVSPAKKKNVQFNFDANGLKAAIKAVNADKPIPQSTKKEDKQLEQVKPQPSSKQVSKAVKEEPKLPKQTKTEISVEGLWYEYGKDLQTALKKSFVHNGFIVRDPSIKFVKGVHGELNITTADIDNFASKHTLKSGTRKEYKFKGIRVIVERIEDGFRTWLDLSQKVVNANAKKSEDKQTKAVKNPAKLQNNDKKNANTSTFPSKAVSTPKSEAKKAKMKASKQEAIKVENKPLKEPTNQSSPEFLSCQRSEARLRSVLSNSNYPLEDKIADLQKQLDEVRKLKPEEADQLVYGVDTLKAMIGMMKASKK